MRFLSLRRRAAAEILEQSHAEDPMSMVGNLFDVSVVLITGLVLALFTVYRLQDLLNPNTNVTVVTQRENGEMVIIDKKGKQIQARKVTGKQLSGEGERLGVAYRLKDGKLIYVPEDSKEK